MVTKRVRFSLDQIRYAHGQQEQHETIVREIQKACTHVMQVHSHYPKPYGDTSNIKKWWVHLTCSLCGVRESHVEDVPICTECLQPLTRYDAGDEVAREIQDEVAAEDPYPTSVYVFKCEECKELFGFPVRIDAKKK